MFALVQNNQFQRFIPEGTAFEIDGVQYPANWLNLTTLEEKAAIGITEIPEQSRPNDKYYWVTDNGDGTFTATPKDLSGCQSQATSEINQTAYSLLLPTDFMDFRPNYTPPQGWLEWREGVRLTCQLAKGAINGCTTVEELMALPAIQWPHDPNYVAPVIEETPVNV